MSIVLDASIIGSRPFLKKELILRGVRIDAISPRPSLSRQKEKINERRLLTYVFI